MPRVIRIAAPAAILTTLLAGCSEAPDINAVYGEPSSRQLELGLSHCQPEVDVSTVEDGGTVTVTVDLLSEHENFECGGAVLITLDDELGSRVVINGATGEELQVQAPD